MQIRNLGGSGLRVSAVGLGCNNFGQRTDLEGSRKVIHKALDVGITLFDTADIYAGMGGSETVLGTVLGDRRKDIVLATKYSKPMSNDGTKQGASRRYIIEAVEASLRRLKTDYIDLYQSHRDELETPQNETLEAFGRLVKAGKVRVIGASNYPAPRLAAALQVSAAHDLPRYESLQPLYNLADREAFERDLAGLCLRENVGVIPYYGLAAGFLTGKYRSSADFAKSPRGARMPAYLNERGLRILAALDAVAARLHAKPVHVALAWLLQQPAVTAPIASATNPEQLDDLITATRLELDAEARRALDAASAA